MRNRKLQLAFWAAVFLALARSVFGQGLEAALKARSEAAGELQLETACALALTNLRSDLAGLSGKFAVLTGVESAQINDRGGSGSVSLDLLHLKNVRLITNPPPDVAMPVRTATSNELAVILAAVYPQTNQQIRASPVRSYTNISESMSPTAQQFFSPSSVTRIANSPWAELEISVGNNLIKMGGLVYEVSRDRDGKPIYLQYRLDVMPPNPTLESAVDAVIQTHAAVSKTNLEKIVDAGLPPPK